MFRILGEKGELKEDTGLPQSPRVNVSLLQQRYKTGADGSRAKGKVLSHTAKGKSEIFRRS